MNPNHQNVFIQRDHSFAEEGIQTDNKCEACDCVFQTPQDLAAHLYYSFSLDEDALDYFQVTHKIKPFPIALKRNIKLCKSSPVWEEDMFKCSICEKAFKNSRGLSQHMGKIHSQELKSHGCWTCSKKFKSKYALKMHSDQVHKKCTMVNCEICHLSLYNKYTKRVHMKKVHGINID